MELKYQHVLTDEQLGKLYEKPQLLSCYYENTHFKTSSNTLLRLTDGVLTEVKPKGIWKISTKHNPEQSLALDDVLNDNITLLAITGDAGTGKTFMAMLGSLYGNRDLTFTREVIQVGEELGMLPGEINDKFSPYMRPFTDNMLVIKDKISPNEFLKLEKRVSLTPLQFLRGGTLRNTTLIVDEAQNCTVETLKMAITRAGEGSKVILCGSLKQIDNRKLNESNNGLTRVIEAFSGQKCFSHIHLIKNERSELAKLADILL